VGVPRTPGHGGEQLVPRCAVTDRHNPEKKERASMSQILALQALDTEPEAQYLPPCFSVAWSIGDIFPEPM
jgi:hypothetical protein